ncbi:MAG: hypothetical protein JWL85_722 [Candidatus Saccharibacteria bacterium]|nr:hypothetical protein [Candidatus Saccharibacteria bacterium]
MKGIFRRGLIAAAGLVFVSTFVLGTVSAQNGGQSSSGNGFRISPVRSEYVIEKGRSEVLTLTLENPSDGTVTAQGVANDFVASDKEDGEPRLILDENAPAPKNSFKSLVGNIGQVTLKGKEKKEIPVTIRIPQNANAGGYYGAVRFIPVGGSSDTGNVGLTASVGTIVLIRVPGQLTERLDLVSLSASKNGEVKNFLTNGDASVLVRLKNSGDIHLKPFGKIAVKNPLGKSVTEYELNKAASDQERANILPGSTRKFDDKLPQLKIPGRYTIAVNVGYSQGSGDLITAKASFWYMPAWAIVILVILLVAIAAGIYYLVNRYRPVKKRA